MGPSLTFHLPAPELRELVSSYYALQVGAEPIDDRLHPEWGNVRFALSGRWTWSLAGDADDAALAPDATLFGPTGHSARITGSAGALLFGFGLLPLGWARLVGRPADRMADRMVPLEELLGGGVGTLLAALRGDASMAERMARIDALLLERLAKAPPADPHIAPIHRLLVSGDITTVSSAAAALGVSQRTLERLCPRLFGFPLKQLLRRQRFLRNLDAIVHNPGRPLTGLLDAGYADQSHFVREFRAFMGVSPSRYAAEPRPMMRLAGAERERVVGQTMQGLHRPPG